MVFEVDFPVKPNTNPPYHIWADAIIYLFIYSSYSMQPAGYGR
jgi:hypothetical protein